MQKSTAIGSEPPGLDGLWTLVRFDPLHVQEAPGVGQTKRPHRMTE